MFTLAGKTVLIFGGSSGMGKATAISVLQLDGTPYIIGRRKQFPLESITPSDPTLVKYASVDCTSESALETFFDGFEQGSFHHIVCTLGESAGCGDIRGSTGLQGLRNQFNMKFFGQIAPISFGVDKIADGGSIVLTSGSLSKRPGKGSTALATANAALEAFCVGLANDLGPRIRVNCVSPGLTNTEMWANMPVAARDGMLNGFGSKLPLGRAGESRDVGEAIAFLLCAEYTTGTTLPVDGGASIRV
jgi:NAD(P)-dependent dehydrogenase (short-subunit alcohol dehydrogenase family)